MLHLRYPGLYIIYYIILYIYTYNVIKHIDNQPFAIRNIAPSTCAAAGVWSWKTDFTQSGSVWIFYGLVWNSRGRTRKNMEKLNPQKSSHDQHWSDLVPFKKPVILGKIWYTKPINRYRRFKHVGETDHLFKFGSGVTISNPQFTQFLATSRGQMSIVILNEGHPKGWFTIQSRVKL